MTPRTKLTAVAGAFALALFAGITALVIPTGAAVDNPVTIMAAGDIAEAGSSTQANATSTGDLIRAANPAYVLLLGDNAYPDGSATDYSTKYDPTWGSFKAKTLPAPGNHEYHSNPPAGYLGYFGQANVTTNNDPAQVWYARDLGNGWRAYSLNSEVSASAGSAQDTWLASDLAAHPNMHYIAYWHQPRYVSGTQHTDQTTMCPLWNRLQAVGADLALVGHEHHMERFAKMDCNGVASSTGIREIVSGGGGNWLYPLASPLHANSQFANGTDFGVLKLVLHQNSYDWSFIESGRCFDTSNNTSSDCATHKGVVADSGTQATNTTVGTVDPAQPALPGTTRHYMAGDSAALPTSIALGYNIHDVSSAAAAHALQYNDQGLIYLGDNEISAGCPAGATASFQSTVNAAASEPKVFGFFLNDEPSDVSCAANLKAQVDYIHANAPGKMAFVELTDYPGTYAAYRPGATNVDLVGIDPYPCQQGTCDLNKIDAQVNAAIAAGIPKERLVPTFQAFGDANATGTWTAPTAAQLQSILDRWGSLLPTPVFDYTYVWACNFQCVAGVSQSVSTQPAWQNVLRAYNTTFPNRGGTGATTPPPSSTPPPTTTTPPTTSTPPPGNGTLDRQIAASADDVEEQGSTGSMYNSSSDLELVFDGSTQQVVGMRFNNVTVPQGATISAANVKFTAKETWSNTSTGLTFQAQASDNALAFTTTAKNVSSRTYGTASVPWAPTAQTAETAYTTPDLKSLIQEVVNRPGWVSDNSIVIKVSGTAGTRTEYAYDGSTTKAPVLHVAW